MSVAHGLVIVVAGVWAGMINTIVGSGTLVTFPVLLALGYPPLTANVSNGLGLVPGSLTGAIGYRRELAGLGGRVARLAVASVLGALLGAVLLLWLPPGAFDAVVPVLVGVAVVLVIVQPLLARRLAGRHGAGRSRVGPALLAGVFGTGVYGGYFGAAQGVLLLALLGIGLDDDLQRHNAVKNVLATVANLVSGLVFAVVAPVSWPVVALIAVGSVLGGLIGARVGRMLSPTVLRVVVVLVGVAALVELLR
ncbi:MAG: sulfite exporter TauE/SafE family protein [Pseudonocardia sp.]|nr:sulfite exporter TauE/SafE family protein [Pseudonocardia sp.]